MLRWYCIQTFPYREGGASLWVASRGAQCYVPTLQQRLSARCGGGTKTVARFARHFFARFVADNALMAAFATDDGRRAGFRKVMCSSLGNPVPVPDRAIEAMKAFSPPEIGVPTSPVYQVGQSILVYTAGEPQQAVFLGYKRNRAIVEMWIMGAEREAEVAVSALEPLEAA